jgi:hypothetical protein
MYVDDFGVHCIFLFGSEVYYNNWESSKLLKLKIIGANSQTSFSCCSILYVDDNDPKCFELVLGTDDGKIFMNAFF